MWKYIKKIILFIIMCGLILGYIIMNRNPFIGYWEAVEVKDDGSVFTWAEVMAFEENLDLYVHSNFVARKSRNPLEKDNYRVDNIKKTITIFTAFGTEETYKFEFINEDTFLLDKEFINLKFNRIDESQVFEYLELSK